MGNTYLEAYTKEKVYIIAGKEFGDLCKHTLIIQKALYGLRSSGLRWWERISIVLKEMGFSYNQNQIRFITYESYDSYSREHILWPISYGPYDMSEKKTF